MALTPVVADLMLIALKSRVTFVGLHSDDPGDDGSHEISGGFPAYSRCRVPWADPENGSLTTEYDFEFDVPGNVTISHLGYWSARTGGDYLGSLRLRRPIKFPTQGIYSVFAGNLVEEVR